jgi:hypothetical protein
MDLSDAAKTYTLLTVGDGLVTQIPALIIAVSSGMIVTRSAAGNAFDVEIRTQVFGKPKTLMIAAGALLFAVVPGCQGTVHDPGDSRDRSDTCASRASSAETTKPPLRSRKGGRSGATQVDPWNSRSATG